MPLKIDLESYKNKILSWVSKKYIIPKILSKIKGILKIKYSLKILKQALSN